jgi:hypothetical protein
MQMIEHNAQMEREKALHDAELYKKASQDKAQREAFEAKKRSEIELTHAEYTAKLNRARIDDEHKHKREMEEAHAKAALIKGQIDAGLTAEYFTMAEYTKNIGSMLANAQKIIIPENIANHIAPAAMINNFKSMLQIQ